MGHHRAEDRSRLRRSGTAAHATPMIPSAGPGKRRAIRPAPRFQRLRGWAPTPVLAGVVALASATGGALATAAAPSDPAQATGTMSSFRASAAVSSGAQAAGRRSIVSRSARRTSSGASDTRLVRAAERLGRERNAALTRFAQRAAAWSAEIELNRWFLPVNYVALTARYGEYGLWASSHTGLDFNGDEGDPIYAVANGVITSVGYDGSYGNKTVLTLQDGTEIWYCHQSRFLVTTGQQVRGGEQIGAIGSTGNVTGSHLHLEVRPASGGTTDPYAAFASNDLL
ncbi:M23 family metallopeptidase [Nocardioides currus]|uniref:M23ase beta-sheet core domain-containing protein n=1 Tax=Nocardioides currus TaxID=2133958 RepID=A0A2R7YXT3_9ACTN|nr:peptidoglycan DD-metalloendopeptidase family protein [Nocardioides currus]PUA80816.1 hypothetical protein C7S10_13605 [Nocardioides currus]